MRNVLPACAVAMVFMLGRAAAQTPTPVPAFQSAVVQYRISGSAANGTETLSVKGGRRRRERHVSVEFMEQTKGENILEINDGTNFYFINLDTMKGTVQPASPTGETYGEEIGGEELLGKPCVVYRKLGQKTWLWEGIPLKVETPLGVKTATSLDLDLPLDDDLFSIPTGVSIATMTP